MLEKKDLFSFEFMYVYVKARNLLVYLSIRSKVYFYMQIASNLI